MPCPVELKRKDVPTPGPGEVVVEIRAAGVSGSIGTAVDYTKPGHSEDASTLTANKGPELILEMLGNINLAEAAAAAHIAVLEPGAYGKIVLVPE